MWVRVAKEYPPVAFEVFVVDKREADGDLTVGGVDFKLRFFAY
jgi:hypothetical protein